MNELIFKTCLKHKYYLSEDKDVFIKVAHPILIWILLSHPQKQR